ncbi:MAG: recombination regulator RecX [Oscillospiraceae bacterium]|nr:recombination regulator RecX [Oscillospiraceae bacterium]
MDIVDTKHHQSLDINNEIAVSKAKQKALAMLSFKAYFRANLFQELKKEYGEKVSCKVLSRLEELGLINDFELSKRYAAELVEKRGFSSSRIERELIKKGVDEDLAGCISKFANKNPTKEISKILESKYPEFRKNEKILRRAVRFLGGCGYTWDEIREVVVEFLPENC